MLVKGLVERFSGGYPLCQSGVRHKTHAARRFPHRSRLAPRATRHTDVALMSQLPNNAIGEWRGRLSWRRGCSVIRRRHRRGRRRGGGRLDVDVVRYLGIRWRLGHARSNCRAREIRGSRGWCQVTSRECTILPVSASITLKQSLPWL